MTTVKKNKLAFSVTIDGKEVKLAVIRPDYDTRAEGDKVFNRALRDARDSGAYTRLSLPRLAKEENIWDDEKQDTDDLLTQRILSNEKKLAKGGIKKGEAREIAIQLRRDRAAQAELRSVFNQLDQYTADAKAENERFNFLVSKCVVDNEDGKRYFSSFSDYVENSGEDWVRTCCLKFAELTRGLSSDYTNSLPENQFLREYGFANEEGRLVDKNGNLVDALYRRVNEDGYLVNEAGELIDNEGTPLTETGEYRVDFVPFLDDEEEPGDGQSNASGGGETEFNGPPEPEYADEDGPKEESRPEALTAE